MNHMFGRQLKKMNYHGFLSIGKTKNSYIFVYNVILIKRALVIKDQGEEDAKINEDFEDILENVNLLKLFL